MRVFSALPYTIFNTLLFFLPTTCNIIRIGGGTPRQKTMLLIKFSNGPHWWVYQNSTYRLQTLFQRIKTHDNLIDLEQMEKVEHFFIWQYFCSFLQSVLKFFCFLSTLDILSAWYHTKVREDNAMMELADVSWETSKSLCFCCAPDFLAGVSIVFLVISHVPHSVQ